MKRVQTTHLSYIVICITLQLNVDTLSKEGTEALSG